MFTRAKIRIQNVLKRQILTDSIGDSINYICERGRVGNILNSVVFRLGLNYLILSRSNPP